MRSVKGATIGKADLPEKVCATCRRPFRWRKKWAKVWDNVRYCSERCRRNKRKQTMDVSCYYLVIDASWQAET